MLADHLAVHLALGWHINNEVALYLGLATQPATGRERLEFLSFAIACFDLADWRQVAGLGMDCVFRKFALGTSDLASTTQATTTTDRININAQASRRIK
jgi:hypothetical protein